MLIHPDLSLPGRTHVMSLSGLSERDQQLILDGNLRRVLGTIRR